MNKINFTTPWEDDYWMHSNGLFCGFNMPEAVEEDFSGLPPYNKRKSFLVDEYPLCPENWMKSEGKTSSYFVAIQEGKGMWLDFNKNNKHQYDVAILVSVQGINAITGLPCKDDCLEQYIEKCPKHNISFSSNRYCEKCEYCWPKQNYISTTGTQVGKLWIDGFRTAEGLIRQYILTKESSKGVASNIIGNDRVYSIGVSFFLSKDKKPINTHTSVLRGNLGIQYVSDWYEKGFSHENFIKNNCIYMSSTEIQSNEIQSNTQELTCGPTFKRSISVEKIEIGAGQKIDQDIGDDPNKLDFWKESSESRIIINYCLEEEAEQILKQQVKQKIKKDGWLENIPVA